MGLEGTCVHAPILTNGCHPRALCEIWYLSALRRLMTLLSSKQGLECGMPFVIFPNSLGSFYLGLGAARAGS